MSILYADLAIPISVDRLFTYLVPEKLRHSAQCGARALAPFGGRTVAVPMSVKDAKGDRPISFVWKLRRPMPADFFRQAKVASG